VWTGKHWGVVRTSVSVDVPAPPHRVVSLYLDYTRWSRLFPATIAGVRVVSRNHDSAHLTVEHRREGLVPNVMTICGPGVVSLWERKRRYEAVFVNEFAHAPFGTRYSIDATVLLARPYRALAPFLRGYVERALRRYTLGPVRDAVERARAS
jgi:hypothetical protein